MIVIDYFVAPQSPWTYLGHERIVSLAARHGARLNCKPADFGKIFSVSGGLPLGKRAPQRQAYRLKELARWREATGLPLNIHPKFFPVAGDDAARLIIAARQRHGDAVALTLAGKVLKAVWADELDISDRTQLVQLAKASGAADLQAQDCDQAAAQAEYEANTQSAIDLQAFGAPWYQIGDEGFWGQDRLDFVARKLASLSGQA